jgi:hypothetical protein
VDTAAGGIKRAVIHPVGKVNTGGWVMRLLNLVERFVEAADSATLVTGAAKSFSPQHFMASFVDGPQISATQH